MNQSTVTRCNWNTTNTFVFQQDTFILNFSLCTFISVLCLASFVLWIFTKNSKIMKSRGFYTPLYILIVFLDPFYFTIVNLVNRERFLCAFIPLLNLKFVTFCYFVFNIQSLKYFTMLRVQEYYSIIQRGENVPLHYKIVSIFSIYFKYWFVTIPITIAIYLFTYNIVPLFSFAGTRIFGYCDIRDRSWSFPLLIYELLNFIALILFRITILAVDLGIFIKTRKCSFIEYFKNDDPFFYRSQNLALIFFISILQLTVRILNLVPDLTGYCQKYSYMSTVLSTIVQTFFIITIVWYPGIIALIYRIKGKNFKQEEFDQVLGEGEYKTKFMEFLKNDNGLQQFHLYEEILKFKANRNKKLAFLIFKNYIEDNASIYVEMSSKVRQSLIESFTEFLEKKVKEIPSEIFNDLEVFVFEGVKESYLSFINTMNIQFSSEKTKLLQSLE